MKVDEHLMIGWYGKLIAGLGCTLIKRISNFPHIVYKEFQKGSVAKLYIANGLNIYG
jgi:hypothetical protein